MATIGGILSRSSDASYWYIADPKTRRKLAGATEPECRGYSEASQCEIVGERKWIVPVTLADGFLGASTTLFDDAAKFLIGKTADEVAASEASSVHELLHARLCGARCTFQCSVKNREYGGVEGIEVQCNKAESVDFVQRGRELLTQISALRS